MIENILSVNSADTTQKIGGVKNAERSSNIAEKEPKKAEENRDEYIPSEEKEPIGLYSVTPDENGEPRISFDKAEDKSADNDNEPEEETVTGNTDSVDREIKNLRNKAQMLSRKLSSADEGTAEEIKRELEQVNAELAQKDNDEYRRRHTIFT
ncbi:MAG: hypothetical protein K2J80_06595, partial [Oscillospiraceae bacterium]|nr:hypothetical protein [Oscillospiraceae bacterium]